MTGIIPITGCSSGFGEAAAKPVTSREWNVVAAMRKLDGRTPGTARRETSEQDFTAPMRRFVLPHRPTDA
jgi:NADP-dependent 3-hydroxy acid dehydrogenase YdfG